MRIRWSAQLGMMAAVTGLLCVPLTAQETDSDAIDKKVEAKAAPDPLAIPQDASTEDLVTFLKSLRLQRAQTLEQYLNGLKERLTGVQEARIVHELFA